MKIYVGVVEFNNYESEVVAVGTIEETVKKNSFMKYDETIMNCLGIEVWENDEFIENHIYVEKDIKEYFEKE